MLSLVTYGAGLIKRTVTQPESEMWLYQTRHNPTADMLWQRTSPPEQNTLYGEETLLLPNSCLVVLTQAGGRQSWTTAWLYPYPPGGSASGCAGLQGVKQMGSSAFHSNRVFWPCLIIHIMSFIYLALLAKQELKKFKYFK